jgi:hypothetical protein
VGTLLNLIDSTLTLNSEVGQTLPPPFTASSHKIEGQTKVAYGVIERKSSIAERTNSAIEMTFGEI